MPENIYFVTAAYVATWLVIIGYLLRLLALMARARESLAHANASGAAS